MKRLAILLGLAGLAAVTGIIIWNGYGQILQALHQAGWGILWTSLYHILSILAAAAGWRLLMPGRKRASYGLVTYALWLRSSVNNLMPVARIGGEVLAVRLFTKYGMRASTAIASTLVELTLSVLAVFVFDIIGITLFIFHAADRHLVWQLLIGVMLSLPLVSLFIFIQRVGFFGLLDKIFNLLVRDKTKHFPLDAAHLDRAVRHTYRRHGPVLQCGLLQLLAWTLGIGEVWLGIAFLGHPFPLLKCFMIEALIQASASAAFAIPGALGVQEAGFLLFGSMLGLSPDIALALAVMRRCRDLILYVPGLIAWQMQEGRWLLKGPLQPKKR